MRPRRRDQRHGSRSPTRPRPTSARATIASSWTRPAPTWERSPRGPTRAGARRPSDPERLAALQRRLLVRAARALAPGGDARLLDLHDLGAARTRRSPAALGEYAGGVEADDLGAAAPAARLARATRASCSCCPSATAPPASSARASGGAPDGRRARDPRPACPGCGEPWLRPTQLPGPLPLRLLPAPLRARLAAARTAASTRRWSGCPPTRTCSASIAATRC